MQELQQQNQQELHQQQQFQQQYSEVGYEGHSARKERTPFHSPESLSEDESGGTSHGAPEGSSGDQHHFPLHSALRLQQGQQPQQGQQSVQEGQADRLPFYSPVPGQNQEEDQGSERRHPFYSPVPEDEREQSQLQYDQQQGAGGEPASGGLLYSSAMQEQQKQGFEGAYDSSSSTPSQRFLGKQTYEASSSDQYGSGSSAVTHQQMHPFDQSQSQQQQQYLPHQRQQLQQQANWQQGMQPGTTGQPGAGPAGTKPFTRSTVSLSTLDLSKLGSLRSHGGVKLPSPPPSPGQARFSQFSDAERALHFRARSLHFKDESW
jgi:hypothetical protein